MTDPPPDDICGWPTANDTACELPPSRPDGRCHLHTEVGDENDPGRPSKLNAEVRENIADVIEQGGSIREACRRQGIHHETFYRWMRLGDEQDEGPYAEFHDRLVQAHGRGEQSYRSALMQIAIESEDTATLMAMLKQRYPDSWGQVDRGEQAGGVTVQLGEAEEYDIDPETLEATKRE